ncbi:MULTISPECIES: TlpA disulfide reductase family protein [Bhargavaea]|uniref:TlpA disulfide reductase family protein n=1 Tax=Bhargavaea changchunensis TaxID=2134037 RepID=A0ABW2NJ89_9BACL|nr:TlpA disulfide reductase family protein [Bhargavaea sp. CC-171006]
MKALRIAGTFIAIMFIGYLVFTMIRMNFPTNQAIDVSEYEDGNLTEGEIPREVNETGLRNGEKAPDFQLENLAGETVSLSDFRGKKVILNFWATWCPPCREEMPEMQSYYEEKTNDRFEIIAVNATTTEQSSGQAVEPFAAELGLTFPILMDMEGTITDQFEVMFFPTTYLLDEDGVIIERIVLPLNEQLLADKIK